MDKLVQVRQPHERQWVFGLDNNEVMLDPSQVMAEVQDWFFDAEEVHEEYELTATEAAQDKYEPPVTCSQSQQS